MQIFVIRCRSMFMYTLSTRAISWQKNSVARFQEELAPNNQSADACCYLITTPTHHVPSFSHTQTYGGACEPSARLHIALSLSVVVPLTLTTTLSPLRHNDVPHSTGYFYPRYTRTCI